MDRCNESQNNFSLKKLAKKVVNVHKDVITMGKAPVALAVSSVTGKPANLKYKTKAGKVVGGIHDESTKKLTATVKRVGDTITLGGASKAVNVIRKDQYKEKPGQYVETRPSNTGIKFIDKASDAMNPVTQIAGTVAGAYTLASGIKSASKTTKIPAPILSQLAEKAKLGIDKIDSIKDTQLLNDMKNGNEIPSDDDNRKLGQGFKVSTEMFVMLVLGLAVLFFLGKSGGNRSTKTRRK